MVGGNRVPEARRCGDSAANGSSDASPPGVFLRGHIPSPPGWDARRSGSVPDAANFLKIFHPSGPGDGPEPRPRASDVASVRSGFACWLLDRAFHP